MNAKQKFRKFHEILEGTTLEEEKILGWENQNKLRQPQKLNPEESKGNIYEESVWKWKG